MKTIGMIGGMSWQSTVTYYEIINETVGARLGGLHSAKLLLSCVDFAEIEAAQTAGDWAGAGELLAQAARGLELAGADFVILCTNTMHKVVPQIQAAVSIPLLHIADACAAQLLAAGIRRVALLGTQYTMTQDFYKDRLIAKGLTLILPEPDEMALVNDIIFNQLCLGIISDPSRQTYQNIIAHLKHKGAEGVILGCTEIGLLIGPNDSVLPIFDTTIIHARAAADYALG